MKLQINGLVLVFSIALVDFVRGEEYSATVSEIEEFNKDGDCHRLVTVSGYGIADKIPVRCDMANYVVKNDKQLVVGDKIYSDNDKTLTVLTPQGCERRTYSDGTLEKTTQLKDDECEEVKLKMMKAFMVDDDEDNDRWNFDVDVSDSSDSSDVSEGKLNAYDELRKWVSDYLDSDEGNDKELKKADAKEDDKDKW